MIRFAMIDNTYARYQQVFSDIFKRIVKRFKRAGYSLDIMRQTACLVFNPIMVEGYAALFSCSSGGSGLRLNDGFDVKLEIVG